MMIERKKERKKKKKKKKKKRKAEKRLVSLCPVVCFVQKIYRLLVAAYVVSGASGESRASISSSSFNMCACIF
jgi:hypothetical protein